MKYICILILIVSTTLVCSCHSLSKKQTVDKVVKVNSQIPNVKLKNPTRAKERPPYTELVFPEFVVKIHDFGEYRGVDGIVDSSKVIINVDESRNWRLIAKSNSIVLQAYDFNRAMELIPNSKTDKFVVSYSFKVLMDESNGYKTMGMSDDKLVKDSLNHFFKLPKSASNFNDHNTVVEKVSDVKRKLKLKDTIAKGKDGLVLGYAGLTVNYRNEVRQLEPEPCIYLKIRRFDNRNKMLDTKFLTIKLIVGEDSD